jgi:hypothetical protein
MANHKNQLERYNVLAQLSEQYGDLVIELAAALDRHGLSLPVSRELVYNLVAVGDQARVLYDRCRESMDDNDIGAVWSYVRTS